MTTTKLLLRLTTTTTSTSTTTTAITAADPTMCLSYPLQTSTFSPALPEVRFLLRSRLVFFLLSVLCFTNSDPESPSLAHTLTRIPSTSPLSFLLRMALWTRSQPGRAPFGLTPSSTSLLFFLLRTVQPLRFTLILTRVNLNLCVFLLLRSVQSLECALLF